MKRRISYQHQLCKYIGYITIIILIKMLMLIGCAMFTIYCTNWSTVYTCWIISLEFVLCKQIQYLIWHDFDTVIWNVEGRPLPMKQESKSRRLQFPSVLICSIYSVDVNKINSLKINDACRVARSEPLYLEIWKVQSQKQQTYSEFISILIYLFIFLEFWLFLAGYKF